MIDLNAIEKGANYSELPQNFVIFICTFDAFGKGRLKYTFKNICVEDKKLFLNDGTTKIFFNTTGTSGELNKDAKNILKFIENNTVEDDFTEKLAQEVIKIKENKEWQVEYMTLMMREREKYNEGIKIGTEKEKYNIAKNLIALGLSSDIIFKSTGLSIEEIEKIRKKS